MLGPFLFSLDTVLKACARSILRLTDWHKGLRKLVLLAWRRYLLQAVSLWSSGTSWSARKHELRVNSLFSSSYFDYVIFVRLQGVQILASSLCKLVLRRNNLLGCLHSEQSAP